MGSRQRQRWGTGPAPTHRDVEVLAWVAEQYAVRADTIALLLGRLSPETPQTIHRWRYAPGQSAELPALSEATVRYHLRRWLRGQAGSDPSGPWVAPGSSPLAPAWTSPARATDPGPWSPPSLTTSTRSPSCAWPSRRLIPRPSGSQSEH